MRSSDVATHLGELLEAKVDLQPAEGTADFGLVAHLGRDGAGLLPFSIAWRQSASVPVIARAAELLRASTSASTLPLVAAPYLSPEARRVCADAGVGWIDLSGNAHIKGPSLLVHVEGKENLFKRPGRPEDPFAPRSARVARALLRDPSAWVTQQQLVIQTLLARSLVSRAIRRLDELKLLERHPADRHLLRPHSAMTLLKTWAGSYDIKKHHVRTFHQYARTGDQLAPQLHQRLVDLDVTHAFTGLASAWLYRPMAAFRLSTAFVDRMPTEEELKHVDIRPVDDGWNIWLIVPNDDDVLREQYVVDVRGIPCVSAVQTWLDLQGHPERAPEAAAALLQLPGLWSDAR